MAASSTPYPVPLTDAQINALAATQATASINAQRTPIEAARVDAQNRATLAAQQAAARALADRQAISGLGLAAADIMKGIGPGISAGYDTAAKSMSDIAGGFSKATADRVRAGEAANSAFTQAQAPGSAPSTAPDATALQDTLYGQHGYIPAGSLETQGAAADRWGQVLPGIETIQTQQDYEKSMAQSNQDAKDAADKAHLDDQQYVQQLLDLAAKEPDLKNQIFDTLFTHEMNRVNQSQNEQKQTFDENMSTRDMKLRERAQALYEKQFGQKSKYDAQRISIQNQNLSLREKGQRSALNKAIADGQQPSASLSKVYGYIVDKNGQAILDQSGHTIGIATKAPVNANQGKAATEALTLRGKPVPVSNGAPGEGKYVAKQGLKGVLPSVAGRPRTTNNPRYAQTDATMNFAEAQNYLASKYGLSRAQARSVLIASGWKPDGQRPKK